VETHYPPKVLIHALRHPIALLAIAVWLLNDHLLKSMFPGIITGKLSDIAGMVVTPLVVAVFVELAAPRTVRAKRRFVRINAWLSIIIVAAAFAAAKTTLAGHDIYVTIATLIRAPLHVVVERFHPIVFKESVVLVRDVTDLIAIPFGVVSVWLLERAARSTMEKDVRAPEPQSIPSDA
jgi:hypothetical protein